MGFATDILKIDRETEAERIVAFIRDQTRAMHRKGIVIGLSGGVDSAVAASLIHRAVGDQLTCIFVDHGLLRQGEAAQVIETFERHMGMRLIAVNAAEEYASTVETAAPLSETETVHRLLNTATTHPYGNRKRQCRWPC